MTTLLPLDLGERVVAAVPAGLSHRQAAQQFSVSAASVNGHGKTTTLVAGLRRSGMVAPFVIDGAIDRAAVEAAAIETYVARVLLPELRPDDTVVMDNLASHKGPRVGAMIKEAGTRLRYLPP